MLLPVVIYLFFSVPLFITLLSWRLAGDARRGWKLRPPQRGRFLWLTIGFALAVPMLLGGLGCSLFTAGGYVYNRIQRTMGVMPGEDYDIILLFACGVAVVIGLIGLASTLGCWRRIKPLLAKQEAARPAAPQRKPYK